MSAGRSGQGTSRDPHPLHLFGGGLDLLESSSQAVDGILLRSRAHQLWPLSRILL